MSARSNIKIMIKNFQLVHWTNRKKNPGPGHLGGTPTLFLIFLGQNWCLSSAF